MPQARRLSSRSCRGRGWHKRGYRDNGDWYFQLKRSFAYFSRECRINENETITELLRAMWRDVSDEDVGKPRFLHFRFFFRRRWLQPSEQVVKTIMRDETIYAKVC